MQKLILFLLMGSLLWFPLVGCNRFNSNGEAVSPNTTNENTMFDNIVETTTADNKTQTTPILVGELNRNSDLIVTLVAYLKQYFVEYDLVGRSFEIKINNMKDGIQPIHVAFDPSNYYFVCGYYNSPSEHGDIGYHNSEEYIWVGYEKETEIQEYYNDMKWAVVFQINKAITIADIFSSGRLVPKMEHFQIYKPTFENGVNVGVPVVFNETFIYLNYPNCYLNRFSQSTSTMYYTKSIYYHNMNTIPCVSLEGQYYIPIWLDTLTTDEIFSAQKALSKDRILYDLGEYYSAIIDVMDTERYRVQPQVGYTYYYGVISLDDFVNDVVK